MPDPSSPPRDQPGRVQASRHALCCKYHMESELQPPYQHISAELIDELNLALFQVIRLLSNLEDRIGQENFHG